MLDYSNHLSTDCFYDNRKRLSGMWIYNFPKMNMNGHMVILPVNASGFADTTYQYGLDSGANFFGFQSLDLVELGTTSSDASVEFTAVG